MTEAELSNSQTAPNPQIRALMELSHEVHRLLLDAEERRVNGHVVAAYAECSRHIFRALDQLFRVKNAYVDE